MQNAKTNIFIYLVRHGQSLGNLDEGVMAMLTDVSLTERGEQEALQVAQWFKRKNISIDTIYSSNYKRALDTASTIANENDIEEKDIIRADSLVELSVGDWSGKRVSDVMTPEVDLTLNSKGIDFMWPDGESFRTVERRISAWIEREILHNPKYLSGERHIVIVTHGNAIRALLYYILGCNDRMIHRFSIDNCSLSIFNYKKHGWYTLTINSTEHLYDTD